jgi:hypothetical protein
VAREFVVQASEGYEGVWAQQERYDDRDEARAVTEGIATRLGCPCVLVEVEAIDEGDGAACPPAIPPILAEEFDPSDGLWTLLLARDARPSITAGSS